MEFTSWHIGDLFHTLNGLVDMSTAMLSSVVNILFAFVVFLLLFRAFTSAAHQKYQSAGLSILYVFILGFLFLGKGNYYLNYVNITGFTEDDSQRLGNQTNDSHEVKPAGTDISGVGGTTITPVPNPLVAVTSMVLSSKGVPMPGISISRSGEENDNTMRFIINDIPHVYVIPAFMDEIAVSLATAAGIGRTGDYYTSAVLRNPNVVFDMAANQLLQDRVGGHDIQTLCNFYKAFQDCFKGKEKGLDFMMNTCNEVTKAGPVSLTSPVEVYNCDNLVRDYGKDLQQMLDTTIGKSKDSNSVYAKAYSAYSSIAQRLQQDDASALPADVEQRIEKSIHDALQPVEAGFSQIGDPSKAAIELARPGVLNKYLVQKPGLFWQDVMSSFGKTPLVRTLIVQNEITIFLSFFLLPLIVLVTFLTNNFKYITEYAFGYLLLKLQLPLWVVGNYLTTGHVFTNLLASPTINGYLISLANGGVDDSDLLTNTVTAGIMSLGVGALFLFGKSAAGGINQGIAAGGEVLKGAMEVAKITAATVGSLAGGVAGIAGLAGAGAGAAGAAGSAAGAAGSAAGSAAGGASSVMGAVGNALQGIAGANSIPQMITAASKGAVGIYRAVQASKLAQMPKRMFDVTANRLGKFMSNESGEIEEMHLKGPEALNEFENTLKESGYRMETKKEEGGDYVLTISNGEGSVRYRGDGKEFRRDPEKGDDDYRQISINKDIFKEKPKEKPKNDADESNKDSNKSPIITPGHPEWPSNS